LFLRLAYKIGPKAAAEARWEQMLAAEARILAEQQPGPRIHSGFLLGTGGPARTTS
jgi:tRNA 2-(methylsulfanyl)-N6-isopentenyladenosine37 hydroxylase